MTYPQADTETTTPRPLRNGSISLAVAEPGFSAEWHPTRNGGWTPQTIARKSNLYAWWVCVEGHEWRTRINNRVAGRLGCPQCTAEDLASPKPPITVTHPTLAAQWHPTRNGTLTPDRVSAASQREVWWACTRNHAWKARVHSRSTTGNGCEECEDEARPFVPGLSKPSASIREDSLARTHPHLAAEWNVEKNDGMPAVAATAHSDILRWWTCSTCGHEWRTTPASRSVAPHCPGCQPHTSMWRSAPLAVRYPALAAVWDSKRNGMSARRALVRMSDTYWWKCSSGHSWDQTLTAKIRGGASCPVCSGRLLVPGVNDLATTNPTAAAHWHPTKNPDTPADISGGSRKARWWRCQEGHEWEAAVRVWNGGRTGLAGCPECRQARIAERREAAEQETARYRRTREVRRAEYPIPALLSAQWHPTRNKDAWPGGPDSCGVNSRRSAWWRCDCGHEWETRIRDRVRPTLDSAPCPRCGAHWNWVRHLPSLAPFGPEANPLMPLVHQGLSLAIADRLWIHEGIESVTRLRAMVDDQEPIRGIGLVGRLSLIDALDRAEAAAASSR